MSLLLLKSIGSSSLTLAFWNPINFLRISDSFNSNSFNSFFDISTLALNSVIFSLALSFSILASSIKSFVFSFFTNVVLYCSPNLSIRLSDLYSCSNSCKRFDIALLISSISLGIAIEPVFGTTGK